VIFPTSDMIEAWEEFQVWETLDISEVAKVEDRYKKATEELGNMVNLEEKFQ